MITVPQIKAARGLLDWTQTDLSMASGVSLRAIAKIELGNSVPRKDTLLAIRGAFENEGVTFLGSHGLEKRDEKLDLRTFTGKNKLFAIEQDIMRTLPDGGEILLANVDNKFWFEHYKDEVFKYVKARERRNITTRCLIQESEMNIMADPEYYRTVPEQLFSQMPYYIYGNKTVFMLFKKQPFRFIMIESATLTDTFRTQFEFNWKMGKKLPSTVINHLKK